MNYSDVRMKGFSSRTTVEQAIAWIDSQVPTLSQIGQESVSLFEATGRILAEPVISPTDVPRFRRAMMDGFALMAEETHGANTYNCIPLQIVGSSMPGLPFQGNLSRGQAVQIMTGAPMPSAADAVLPAEHAEIHKDGAALLISGELSSGKHVGAVGEDVRSGDVVLAPGRKLRPQDIGVLSSIGCRNVTVVPKPSVRILITGNELLPAGEPPKGYQITDANGPMLHALVVRDGGQPTLPIMVPDNPDVLRAELMQPADVILVSGGSSVGLEDHAPRLVAEIGTLAIHGLAMRPSSPAGLGKIGSSWVFLLPGNPVSCLCAYDFFAGRVIRSLAGLDPVWPYRRTVAQLARKLVSTVGRLDYARVKLHGNSVEPIAISGASILSSTTQADGFVIIPDDSEGYAAGTNVEVLLY